MKQKNKIIKVDIQSRELSIITNIPEDKLALLGGILMSLEEGKSVRLGNIVMTRDENNTFTTEVKPGVYNVDKMYAELFKAQ